MMFVKRFSLRSGAIALSALALHCSSWGKFWLVGAEGTEITAYSIPSLGVTATISGNAIVMVAPSISAHTPQIASFSHTGDKVTVAGAEQTSGATVNAYDNTVVYTVHSATGSTQDYYVLLLAPRALAGGSLRLWLRADALSLSDGDGIGTWNDESGFGNTVSQATASLKPKWHSNVLNGKPVSRWTYTPYNSTLDGTCTSFSQANDGSFFVVLAISTAQSNRAIVNFCGANGRGFDLSDQPNTQLMQGKNGSGYNYTSAFNIGLNNFVAVGSVQTGLTSLTEIWNGDLKATKNALYWGSYSTSGTIEIGAAGFEGDIAEMLYFDAALSQADTDKVYCYLNTKYALASTRQVCQL